MSYSQAEKKIRHPGFRFVSIATVVFLLLRASVPQTSPQPETLWSQELKQNPGLPAEFAHLVSKLQRDVEFPVPRNESNLLPLLPDSTTYYAAFPNYGDALHHALLVFRRELEQSEVLRNWWQQGQMARTGPQLEEFIEKLYALSRYVGNEVVISGQTQGTTPNLLIAAEVKKPGLKDFLSQMLDELPGNVKSAVLVLDPRELANVASAPTMLQPVVLVRPDLVVAGIGVEAVRNFNNLLERGANQFGSTPFGQRVVEAYRGGASVLIAADLERMLAQVPLGSEQNQIRFDRTGFEDAKYLIWEHTNSPGQAASQMELSFTGPRHGMASWLAAPAPLGSLDFVSPNAVLVGTVVLKNLGEIYDNLREIASASNASAFAMLDQMQKTTNINIKTDLLNHFTGEVTFELNDIVKNDTMWRAELRVEGADRLRQTLNRIFSSVHVDPPQMGNDGITYYHALIPSAQTPKQLVYAFVDGYMVIAPTPESAAEAVRLDRSGGSLGKSTKFVTSLTPGTSSQASALIYEDPIALAILGMRPASPETAENLSQLASAITPMVVCAYGDERAIRAASNSGGADIGAILLMAGTAIPNLLRARTSANESSAVAMIRTIGTAQMSYAASYPQRGYARDLASLGPDPNGSKSASPEHASFLDATLGNPSCTATSWCTKSGYRFMTTATCMQRTCKEFVAVGSPVSTNTGMRNFCSTSDGLVRFSRRPPLISPISAAECRQWAPLQ
jgi:hypothetical protein